jgi:hypothetical protein
MCVRLRAHFGHLSHSFLQSAHSNASSARHRTAHEYEHHTQTVRVLKLFADAGAKCRIRCRRKGHEK